MWIPAKVIEWLSAQREDAGAFRDAFTVLHGELQEIRGERDSLRLQAAIDRVNMDWLRTKVNGLEHERVALIEKAYDIKLPSPQLVRNTTKTVTDPEAAFSFDDIGEDLARALGFPSHATNT